MSPIVVFNELWLLSERDASARQLKFHPRRNLLSGSNGTGKSRVLKHLVWALGWTRQDVLRASSTQTWLPPLSCLLARRESSLS